MEGDTDDSVTDDTSTLDKPQKEGHERPLECQARACNRCRQRKIRCDRSTPCSQCIRAKTRCMYSGRYKPREKRQRVLISAQ
ncbi:hypothetical protein BDV27DRAFT_9631 [Aspergillus caelatus]|uniref:Zn(2)-C6 fungal-type domain-containing protein n=1 Tax=Aspergillus caelatus TaxID=61420 RepID=A0A5N7AI37_9EURO|nr:uncharacterized protein BDV27DRAFT_9631 [Aspergillus caelatus]KAE8369415.1 hypothetical protein BDV27DRAFT_9631 [Aspergillus caelatus]